MINYKPDSYNSLSPYLIIDDAEKLINLFTIIFDAKILRQFDRTDGKIAHAEIQIHDSILMISESTPIYPAHKMMLHLYVPDVMRTYYLAISNGCQRIDEPGNSPNDPDMRGSFYDFAGNYWSVTTMNYNGSDFEKLLKQQS